ncbi:Fur family transcriptional regulator [Paenibacillus cremeus]|uniref:Transcriptional repressor n=1 Tax=Paenibacillus cremeus TaxID=2163881 RepID=A0A559KD24_9BACL|nr:Fur family transcriptional regulator [Paenibacillus cremeus]TVY10038.1 transcriptional repressor [Paenibacillus cremeus]
MANHHKQDIESTMQDIVKAMSAKGWRITDQRKSLATLFAEAEGFLSPKDVYDSMRQQYPGVSFDTVYRNLRLLSEMGVLEQIYLNDGLKFRARCGSHHHHHLICLQCEKTVPFEFCPMLHMAGVPADFQVVSHRFEIFGYCPSCESTASSE